MELLAIGLIAGCAIGFFFGFKAGQVSAVTKLKQLAKADHPEP